MELRKEKAPYLLVLVVITFFILFPNFAGAITIISIQPPVTNVNPGDIFNLSVDITDVTDLYAFQFDIGFNPSILLASNISEGPFLPGGGTTSFLPGIIDNITGTVSFTADSLIGFIPGVSGNGALATLSFQYLALGTSSVDVSNVILLDSALSDISFSIVNATVSPVPEPTTLFLVGSGLIGVLGLLKKFRAS